MKTGIIFDLDGTLLNTLEDLRDSLNVVLSDFGYPERTLEEVRRFIGNGALVLIQRSVPEGADPMPVLAAFKDYYSKHCYIKTRPYDGIMDVLDELKEAYPLAVVSNKPDIAAKAMCADLFPGVYALGESAGVPRKPAPDMVRKAMDAIGVERCIYVGDSEVDVATANSAGVPCISVLWGFRERDELLEAGAEYFCETSAQLKPLIDKILEESQYGQ